MEKEPVHRVKWYCQYYFTPLFFGTFKPFAPMTHNTVFSCALEADRHWLSIFLWLFR